MITLDPEELQDKKCNQQGEEKNTADIESDKLSPQNTDVKNANATGLGSLGRSDENLSDESEANSKNSPKGMEKY
ncbi:MAG: hypothetical protein ICV66_13220 [Chitinophagaceae bacterium]|nr:hypothetical protein [Chitinophagaceae bacterium]